MKVTQGLWWWLNRSMQYTYIDDFLLVFHSNILYGSEAWNLLQEDLRKLEDFHMCCQHMILGICWHNFIRNTEVASTTNLPCIRDIIMRRRNSLFGHLVRLDDHTPAHCALSLLSQVATIQTGSCPPGWRRWTTQLVASANRRRHTFWHSRRVDQGSPLWTHRDWVDATDLCRLCDLMMMMMIVTMYVQDMYMYCFWDTARY